MRWITFKLTATDTPATIASLAGLTDKHTHITRAVIYPEAGNNNGVNGPARIGGSTVDRVAADAGADDDDMPNGIPLQPGIPDYDTLAECGGGVYSFTHLYISGELGDTFTIGYITK
jgi:hypothetical protein